MRRYVLMFWQGDVVTGHSFLGDDPSVSHPIPDVPSSKDDEIEQLRALLLASQKENDQYLEEMKEFREANDSLMEARDKYNRRATRWEAASKQRDKVRL